MADHFMDLMMKERSHYLEPYEYLVRVPGKDIRSLLIDSFNEWFQAPPESVVVVKKIVSMLHNASLLIDDIEDNSKLRRGVPVAHSIYGIPATVNAANYAYFLALEECMKSLPPGATNVFTEELVNLHHGQGSDIYWRDHDICPTEEEYIAMVKQKTGGLFRLAVGLLRVCATCSQKDTNALVDTLGVYFQVLDDYLNLRSEKYHENKSYCEDITEGKFSFPIIHSIRATVDKGDSRLRHILQRKTEDSDVKTYALHIMEETGSLEHTKRTLDRLSEKANELVVALGGNALLNGVLESWRSGHVH